MEELVTLFELVERPDKSLGIGNTIEVSREEARLLIEARKAKHELSPIGEVPNFLLDAEVVADGDHKHKSNRSRS